ncbi:MAG: hypothetical protein ACYDEB_08180 [Dehalococcoidia bacterium]
MRLTVQPAPFAYARGEEVLASLAGVDVHHMQGGGRLAPACVPPWMIGTIIGARRSGAVPAYLLRFLHDDCDCVCWVDEAAIEGTA